MPRRRTNEAAAAELAAAMQEFNTCVRALDFAQDEVDGAAEVMAAARENAKAKGFDTKAMDEVRKLYNRVQKGKTNLASAQNHIRAIETYAGLIGLMDQQDLFVERDGDEGVETAAEAGAALN